MALIYNGITVKGRTYNQGDSFTSAASTTWYGSSDKTNGSGTLPSGASCKFVCYSDYSWSTVRYCITSPSANGNYQCWVTDTAFPQGTYTISYNANGGSSTPSSQTKTYGSTIALAGKISKASTTATGYKVTFNANGGSCSTTSLTATNTISYTFSKWKASNGTLYDAGASYTANEGTTMTAQWNSSTSYGTVNLPTTATRDGYIFLGWATSSSGTTTLASPYKPTANVTLYAVWQEIPKVSLINCKSGGYFVKGIVRLKDSNGNWNLIAKTVKQKSSGSWQ